MSTQEDNIRPIAFMNGEEAPHSDSGCNKTERENRPPSLNQHHLLKAVRAVVLGRHKITTCVPFTRP